MLILTTNAAPSTPSSRKNGQVWPQQGCWREVPSLGLRRLVIQAPGFRGTAALSHLQSWPCCLEGGSVFSVGAARVEPLP